MLYSQLPTEMQQAMDRLHEAMTRHRKTMAQLQSMGPELLQPVSSSHDKTPLHEQLQQAQSDYQRLAQDFQQLQSAVSAQQAASQEALTQATLYAAWPVEGLAARQGVRLTAPASAEATTTQQLLEEARTRAIARVDSIHRMPSPYYWDQLRALERRAVQLMEALQKGQKPPLQNLASAEEMTHALEEQDLVLHRVTAHVQRLREHMQRLRVQYRLYETGVNVLDQHAIQEQERQRQLQEQVLMQYVQATQSANTATSTTSGPVATPFGTPTPAPSASFGSTAFGATAAPTAFGAAPGATSNLFGATPAPTTTAFGSATPAPAPAFGSATPAPATALGSATPATAFGSTTPAPTSAFGSATPAPAFGSTTPAPAFGSSTPAPVTTPAFGSATPAPVTTPAFGSFASSTANKKNKGGSRSLGRVRR
jgi:hypothetical protein